MKITSEIKIENLDDEDKKNIQKLFEFEEKNLNNRVTYELNEENKNLIFKIVAKDTIALRSCMGLITKTLSIYQRTNNLIEEEKNE